jgi:hypothetical protein
VRAVPIAILVVAAAAASGPASQPQTIPARLTDQEFWRIVSEFSEPSGFFRSENFVGNENSLQHTIPELTRRVQPGGVYIGVAPDQNFTLMVALRPRIAFIVDIRRQNLVQHLVYKAIIESSPTRSAFLSMLFSRPAPEALSTNAPVDSVIAAFMRSPPNRTLYSRNLGSIKQRLTGHHGFALTQLDTITLAHVFESFYLAGPGITYNFPDNAGSRMPTFATMIAERDGAGVPRSYLADEQLYGILRQMQLNNLIVPIVGDFGGPRALRSVGQYIRERGAIVTTFYTSNVEQYLFQSADGWARFYGNMATLPLDSTSTLIRSVPNGNARGAGVGGWPGPRSTMLLSFMNDIVAAFRAGRIVTYSDVVGLSRQ